VSHPEIEKLVKDLNTWCKARRGRIVEIAKILGVSPQLVSDWFSRKADPMTEQFLLIRDFLRKEKRKERRSAKRSESVLKDIEL
jgi:predicted transcriptional regulator